MGRAYENAAILERGWLPRAFVFSLAQEALMVKIIFVRDRKPEKQFYIRLFEADYYAEEDTQIIYFRDGKRLFFQNYDGDIVVFDDKNIKTT